MDGQRHLGLIGNAVLIAGPTASGKSRLAMQVAEQIGGIVVNADSMQVYSVLDTLTARPSPKDLARVPHALYGHVHPAAAYSTGAWARDVAALASSGLFDARPPVFVGGTGLYFRALTEGISEMPDIPAHVRDRWRYRLMEEGSARLHRILLKEDPATAGRLKPSDGQRIARALEVLEASGRSILDWQATAGRPIVDRASSRAIVLEAERAELAARIDRRFETMLAGPALAEVEALAALKLAPDAQAMKAIGVRELLGVIAGALSRDEAATLAKAATRQYAKRQATWFRHQLGPEWQRVEAGDAPLAALLAQLKPDSRADARNPASGSVRVNHP